MTGPAALTASTIHHRPGCPPEPRLEALPGPAGYTHCLDCGGTNLEQPAVTGALSGNTGAVSTDDLMRPAPQPAASR